MHAVEWAGGDFGLLEVEAAKAEGVKAREGAGINEDFQAGWAATFEELLNYWWEEENNEQRNMFRSSSKNGKKRRRKKWSDLCSLPCGCESQRGSHLSLLG